MKGVTSLRTRILAPLAMTLIVIFIFFMLAIE